MDQEILEYYVEHFNKQKGQPYPCGNQTVICAIITNNKDTALSVMEEKGATLRKQSRDRIEWELNNEIWRWQNWNWNNRGYRFYKLIVDKNIDEELFHCVKVQGALYCRYMEII